MGMRLVATFWTVLGVYASALGAPHTRAELLLDKLIVRPGDTALAGVRLEMAPKWHTYWQNPGASGMATRIKWSLPPGVTAGAIQWPVPEKLPDQDLTTYVYQKEVILLVPLKVSPQASGELAIKAAVSWLECEMQCVPGSAEVSATLTVGDPNRPSAHAALLDEWLRRLPSAPDNLEASAWWDQGPTGNSRAIIIQWKPDSGLGEPDFYPDGSKDFEVGGETERLSADMGHVRLRKTVQKLGSAWPRRISGVLVGERGDQRAGYEAEMTVAASERQARGDTGKDLKVGVSSGTALWRMLLYAFVGGLILNIMPCVLPVIALKILGFVQQASESPARIRKMGLVYALGVWVSFLVLAGLVIGVKAAGHRAGWGMQFGNPQFLVLLTVLMTMVALNLFGLFEINPGGKVMDQAGTLASRGGTSGAFFNGVLATVLATPCTAPFLGVALGFAFAASVGIILLMFSAVALGLATPYLVLSWNPRWLRFLPRPGAWMQGFKVALGFPMLGTAAWLLGLTQIHYGGKSFWLALFLVALGMAAWVYGRFVQRAAGRPMAGIVVTILLLVGGYLFALENQMHWRSPEVPAERSGVSSKSGGIPWEKWSPDAVTRARTAGRPVLVDFTADWCLTCQANKKFALEIPSVRARLKK